MNQFLVSFLLVLLSISSASAQPYFINAAIGVADPSGTDTSSADVLRFSGGYRMLDFLAVEVGVSELEFESRSGGIAEIEGQEIALLAFARASENVEAYLRVALHNWSADVEGTVDQLTSESDDKDIVWGGGVARVLDTGAIKFELNQYNLGAIDATTILFSLEARF